MRFHPTVFVPLAPNQKLYDGRISVIRQLSCGGLSAVYLARSADNALIVLKESVVPDDANDQKRQKAIDMFTKESTILSSIRHPQIARVFDHFVENGRHYLSLQYIPGETLRQHTERSGPQPDTVVIQWAQDLANILSYLHEQDPAIIHRDISPENCMLNEEGKVILIDFGAANEFIGTATGTIVGKQSYIAPEQFRGKARPQSDLYSLGATMYYLATGQNPEPMKQAFPRTIRAEISEQLDQIIGQCLSPEVNDRPRSALELRNKLAALTASRDSIEMTKQKVEI